MKNVVFPGQDVSNIVHHRRCEGNGSKAKQVKEHMEEKKKKTKSKKRWSNYWLRRNQNFEVKHDQTVFIPLIQEYVENKCSHKNVRINYKKDP